MRILQIGAEWPTEHAGGLNTYVYELTRALWNQNVELQGLVVGSDQITASTGGRINAVARTEAKLQTRLWQLRRAALSILKNRPVDVITSHFALYALPIIDRLAKFPTVVHFHGPWASEGFIEGESNRSGQAKALLERGVYRKARRLIVLSRAFKQELVTTYDVHPDRVRIIAGGVDTGRFNIQSSREEARSHLGWPQGRPIMVTVRRLVNRMGLEALIDATKLLRQQHPNVLLYIGGKGPLTAPLQSRVQQLGLQDNVKLLGFVPDPDLPFVYRAADFSIVPSQALEGFGLTAAESLSAGTPVLVSPIGGLPEIVRPFAPQCVFDDLSSECIASTLARALNKDRFLPSEHDCRSYALAHYQWSKVASLVLAEYDAALGERQSTDAPAVLSSKGH